ncbi:hypothetical protein [Demequina sp. SO4-18]|uniref:hypothetical protein n=1 Tax=Demequina sp. SO4-18 TaxID=3401026 RepID=UPI003B596085
MSKDSRERTEDLQNVADEVEEERQEQGRLPMDGVPESESEDGPTREDHQDEHSPLSNVDDATRAGAMGAASRIRGPGL